jgi:hypothetical protein
MGSVAKLGLQQGNVRAGGRALDSLLRFIEERRGCAPGHEEGFEAFEREVHRRFAEAEREFVGEELARLDVSLPEVRIDGVLYRQVVSGCGEYMTAAGPVKVLRQRYRAAGANGASECPLELRAGIVEGFFTPLAARMGLWVVTHLTPAEGEQLFAELGGMSPSRSSLDRLPKALSEKWEAQRAQSEEQLREQEPPVERAAVLAVSLDGVMAPMKDGARQDKREHSRQQGKPTRGPAGFREVGCGTLSHYDGAGERLRTRRHARMPEPGKRSLKRQLVAEVEHALKGQPQLRLVKVADGARDNWEFLAKALPPGEEVVDFYHAAEHLRRAFGQVYGEASPKALASFEEYRHLLLTAEDGVNKVIRTAYLPSRPQAPLQGARAGTGVLPAQPRTHGLRTAACAEPADRLGRGRGSLQDAGDPAHETLGTTMEHRRRSGHPQLAGAGSERTLRCSVEAGLRRIPP